MITKELQSDLIITALEGGSNYWYLIKENGSNLVTKYKSKHTPCFSEAFYKAIDKGETIPVHDIENGDELGEINKKSIKLASQILLKEYKHVFANIISENYDANDADIWFQLAVMGEVIYG